MPTTVRGSRSIWTVLPTMPGIAAEALEPQLVAEHDDLRPSGSFSPATKPRPRSGPHAQHVEEGGAHLGALEARWPSPWPVSVTPLVSIAASRSNDFACASTSRKFWGE